MTLSKIALKALNVASVYTNNNKEVVAANMQALIDEMIESMFPVTPYVETIPAWVADKQYPAGANIYVIFNSKIWQYLGNGGYQDIGVEPGTNDLVWKDTNPGVLTHVKDNDLKLGIHESLIDGGGTATINLNTASFNIYNTFALATDAGDGDATYTLQTGSTMVHPFLVYVPTGAAYTVTFPTNASQDTRGINLALAADDFAVFQRIGNKTRLLYTNVNLTSAETNSINEVSTDIIPNVIAIAESVAIIAESSQVNIGGSHTVNEHVGKYIVAAGTTIASLTLHKITANDTVGLITIATPIIETATYDLQLIEPTQIIVASTDNNLRVYADDNIIVRVPAIAEDDNGNKISILREWGGDETKKVWIELQNNLNGSALHSLLSDGDLIEFTAHTTGIYHFDLLNRIINA